MQGELGVGPQEGKGRQQDGVSGDGGAARAEASQLQRDRPGQPRRIPAGADHGPRGRRRRSRELRRRAERQTGRSSRHDRARSISGSGRPGASGGRQSRGYREGLRGRAQSPTDGRSAASGLIAGEEVETYATNVATERPTSPRRRSRARGPAQPPGRLRSSAVPGRGPVPHRAGWPVPQCRRDPGYAPTARSAAPSLRRERARRAAPQHRDDRQHQASREPGDVHREDHPGRRGGRCDHAPRSRDRASRRLRVRIEDDRRDDGAQVLAASRSVLRGLGPRRRCPAGDRRTVARGAADGQRKCRLYRRRQEHRAPEERPARDVHARGWSRDHAGSRGRGRARRRGLRGVERGCAGADQDQGRPSRPPRALAEERQAQHRPRVSAAAAHVVGARLAASGRPGGAAP